MISKYILEFTFFSFLGWVWESVFCTLRGGKWERRGFLFGPVCPIYGVGAVAGCALVDALVFFGAPALSWWQVILVSFFGSIVLEYSTSWALEKLFHAYWWDYSNMPLNINGRVCLPASLAFAAAGLLVVYVLHPLAAAVLARIPPVLCELLALTFTALIAADVTVTVTALNGFDKKIMAADKYFNDHMTDAVDGFYRTTGVLQQAALRRIKGFRHPKITQERIRAIIERIRRK